MTRPYDNSRRAAAAAATTESISAAAEGLLTELPEAAVTLQLIAARADVTVQTVLRHMGSREACFVAVAERVAARVEADRGASAPGDIAGALAGLLTHYEHDGRLVLNLLAQETSAELAREAATRGRAFHRAWVERCFGPHLPAHDRDVAVDALVAATDLYVWKLLRLDLGRPAAVTATVIDRLVRAVLEPR